uniref:Segregation and condensation protein B n=1 Tax=Candidatus Kentrum sp. TC TaxID=2126339 RepID=A0A450Y8L0_9GAMM|nr:MAG: segregation and condensation protein B [Candidatus Kentron sp. TC]VFK41684.1 MAG: segregation and condensation protein B [Candidatus Kentron sp. TC]VFK53805.1 MAG: segregation and condensation protein B [Candidatus Kentron sp. TC]
MALEAIMGLKSPYIMHLAIYRSQESPTDFSEEASFLKFGMDFDTIKKIIEAALLAADQPLSINDLSALFTDFSGEKSTEKSVPKKDTSENDLETPSRDTLKEVLSTLREECESRSIELKEVASGFQYQIRSEYAEYIQRLWIERPVRYSRALLETLAIIVYRQPITRGEIEEIRGVSVASSTIKTLRERRWIRVLGHRDVPGRPAIYGTTREFLNYFGLKTLDELPPLSNIRNLDSL